MPQQVSVGIYRCPTCHGYTEFIMASLILYVVHRKRKTKIGMTYICACSKILSGIS